MFFSFDTLHLRYDPFPIGVARPLMAADTYGRLVESYPPLELFQYFSKVGHKYVLSEKFNAENYDRFIRENALWRDFHAWVKSDDFSYGVMHMLREHGIDLGYDAPTPPAKRLMKRAKALAKRRTTQMEPNLKARFEFSMLPADGGSVTPHSDEPGKVVTLVISMLQDGEWDPAYGGGTDVNKPKDERRLFNRMNAKAAFEEMEILDSFPYEPNQAVIFVKTFNSWHSVRPMTGPEGMLRRTLTINIEARG
ncbi:hypothetical protein [Aquibaculum sediminis]|uniref:hypothetical protein n=1 Tax=Aquibaculum sediminis TaxID=3231907 RepID=UPI00345266C0